jgi:fructosamine-3-kinase
MDRPVRITDLMRLHGGMTGSIVVRAKLASGAGDVVLKISKDPRAFLREAANLKWLAANTEFPVPKALAEHSREFGMLAIERLMGMTLGEARSAGGDFRRCEREMADALARLHGHTASDFGPLVGNERFATWAEVFGGMLGGFRDPVTLGRLDEATLRRVQGIVEALPHLIPDRRPARLVHGDVWATNVIVRRVGDEWRLSGFVDLPAARYADTEFELAYLLVFDTVGRDFFERYAEHHEIDEGFAFRKLVYHLHTMLVHVWLFGDERYRASARDLAARIAGEIGVD